MQQKTINRPDFFAALRMFFRGIPFIFNILTRNSFKTQSKNRASEAGYGLLVSLGFVGFIAGVITIAADNERASIAESQARAAAIHLVTTARAARIIVRDNSGTVAGDANQDGVQDNAYDPATLAGGGPTPIPVATMINAGLLPQSYSPINAYGQTIQIFAETWPLNNAGGISTAFVFLGNSPRVTASDMQLVSLAAYEFDTSFDAPLFDGGGNISAACNGGPYVVRWGSAANDCLNAGDMAAFGVAFNAGNLVAPVWQTSIHDTRALMRFAQPNNPAGNVMTTDMLFGQPDTVAGNIDTFVPDGAGGFTQTATPLTNVFPDDSSNLPPVAANATQAEIMASDLRTDIIGINQIDVRQMVLTAQNAPGNEVNYTNAGGAASANDVNGAPGPQSEVLNVAGNINVDGSTNVTGRLPNPTGGRMVTTAGVMQIDHGLTVFRDGAGPALDVDIAGISDVDSARSGNMSVGGNAVLNTPGSFLGTNTGTLGTAIVANGSGNPGVVFANIETNGAPVATNNFDVISVLDTTGTNMNLQGDAGSGFTLVSEQMSVGTGLTTGALTVENGMIVEGAASLGGGTTFQDCASGAGRCPDIQELPRPCQIDGTC